MSYPLLEIYPQRIMENARILRQECLKRGIEPVAVIKGFAARPEIVAAFVKVGYTTLASARLPQLAAAKEAYPQLRTMALRISMPSEVKQMVQFADISLESERYTLDLLDQESLLQNKTHDVILMRDLGDLREGIFDAESFYALAEYVEQCQGLHLLGIGVNLTCYGSIIPDERNLGQLAADAREIERRLGRRLQVVSGGSTSSLPLLLQDKMPAGITQLRLGEALVVPCDLIEYWGCPLPGLRNDGLILRAEIVELNCKPTMPQGRLSVNAFGCEGQYVDRGIRRRALLAIGVLDVGDESKLIPREPGVHILGASSDHLIVDIEDCPLDLQLGGTLSFELHYKAMLFSCSSPMIAKTVLAE